MKMEKKFREALDKVLSEKIFKNESALCSAAGVDQGGVNKFIRTMKFRLGKGEAPDRLKDNLNLDIVSKLIDAMGGELLFPWESKEISSHNELQEALKTIEKQKEEIKIISAQRDAFKEVLKERLSSPVEYRENKSSA